MATRLAERRCQPCGRGTSPLPPDQVAALLGQLQGWRVEDGKRIVKRFRFRNFADAVAFVNKIAPIAEAEGHHPDLDVGWGRVEVSLTTHAIGGLSENDFILAAKIDHSFGGT
jgi:4a-hydroxytetrahydrobiopterin dehydratase